MKSEAFSQLVRERYSVRDFRPDPIPADVFDEILEDARYCPSWSNTRPYLLAVAHGEQTQRLREAYLAAFDAAIPLLAKQPKALLRAALTRRGRPGGLPDADFKTWGGYPSELNPARVRVGAGLYEKVGIARGDKAARRAAERRNCEFFGAPTVVFGFVHSGLMPFAAQDLGLMFQTLMLSAQARGVGSCALGTLATWRHPVDAEFEIPKPYRLVTGVALGYATSAPINEFRAEHPPVKLAKSR